MLAMTVGTGISWRSPRSAAANGGAEFLAAWLVLITCKRWLARRSLGTPGRLNFSALARSSDSA